MTKFSSAHHPLCEQEASVEEIEIALNELDVIASSCWNLWIHLTGLVIFGFFQFSCAFAARDHT